MRTREVVICDLVRNAIVEIDIEAVTIVSLIPISQSLVKRLLDNTAVIALFHPDCEHMTSGEYHFDPKVGPPRVGPTKLSKCAFLLGRGRLGSRAAAHFARAGVERMVIWESCVSRPKNISIRELLAKEFASAFKERVALRIENAAGRNYAVRRFLETSVYSTRSIGPWLSNSGTRSARRTFDAHGPIVHAIGSLGAGGAERQLRVVATNMRRRAFGVKILCLNAKEESTEFFADGLASEDIEVIWNAGSQCDAFFASDEHSQRAWKGYSASLPAPIREAVLGFVLQFERLKPQVVHSWLDYTNVTAGLAAVLCGVPKIVLGCRSLGPIHFQFYKPYFKSIYRALMERSEVRMTANSVAGARDYASWLEIDPSNIKVIRNAFEWPTKTGAKASFLNELSIGYGPVIGTVGRIAEEKRPYLWLQIAHRVLRKRPDATFLWVGSGPLEEQLRAEIEAFGLGNRVHLVGVHQDVEAAISAMSVMLLTSRVEGLPNVLIEAQALGVPVVSAAVGGAPEAFQEGATGLGVQADRPDDFAAALFHFLDNPDAMDCAKKCGPRFVKMTFAADKIIPEFLSLYGMNASAPVRCG